MDELREGDRVKVLVGRYVGEEGQVVEVYGDTVKVAIEDLGDRKFRPEEVRKV